MYIGLSVFAILAVVVIFAGTVAMKRRRDDGNAFGVLTEPRIVSSASTRPEIPERATLVGLRPTYGDRLRTRSNDRAEELYVAGKTKKKHRKKAKSQHDAGMTSA